MVDAKILFVASVLLMDTIVCVKNMLEWWGYTSETRRNLFAVCKCLE